MLGGIAGMASFVAYQKLSGKELPQKEEVEGEEKLGKGHWLPFILLLGILLLMNLIPAVKPFVSIFPAAHRACRHEAHFVCSNHRNSFAGYGQGHCRRGLPQHSSLGDERERSLFQPQICTDLAQCDDHRFRGVADAVHMHRSALDLAPR